MAPKKNPAASTSAAPSSKPTNLYVVDKVWNGYWETTSHQTLVIDAFLVFLLLVGGVQFLYFLTCSHDPYNAFLAGFIATVGQFVLTVSLRMQTDPRNKTEFPGTSPERSFADFIFGSLILQLFCVNYLN